MVKATAFFWLAPMLPPVMPTLAMTVSRSSFCSSSNWRENWLGLETMGNPPKAAKLLVSESTYRKDGAILGGA